MASTQIHEVFEQSELIISGDKDAPSVAEFIQTCNAYIEKNEVCESESSAPSRDAFGLNSDQEVGVAGLQAAQTSESDLPVGQNIRSRTQDNISKNVQLLKDLKIRLQQGGVTLGWTRRQRQAVEETLIKLIK